jgi:hypothetical protein
MSFDEYSTLSLPLPESSLIKLNVVINLLPEEIKLILSLNDAKRPHLEFAKAKDLSRRETFAFDA